MKAPSLLSAVELRLRRALLADAFPVLANLANVIALVNRRTINGHTGRTVNEFAFDLMPDGYEKRQTQLVYKWDVFKAPGVIRRVGVLIGETSI